MRVISFVTQKGGSGKTTLAFCCAVAAQEKGKRTLILDMDPQGTATAWFKDRINETRRSTRARQKGRPKGLQGCSDCRQNQNTFQAFAE